MHRVIDGKAVAARVRAEVAARVAELSYQPGLAVVRVGADPASTIYVRNKDRAAKEAGIRAETLILPQEVEEETLLTLIRDLNSDPSIDGILVQLPLPPQISQDAVIRTISPEKDVDGFHPLNAGLLATGHTSGLLPCTPKGVMHLLHAAGVNLRRANAVVVGRSNIVGRPMAQLLTAADCTVTLCHSRTIDPAYFYRGADIIVVATGRPGTLTAGMLGDFENRDLTVIDVGITRRADGSLVGDVAYEEVASLVGAITPVPGGVGPMTIACLLENTVQAAVARRS